MTATYCDYPVIETPSPVVIKHRPEKLAQQLFRIYKHFDTVDSVDVELYTMYLPTYKLHALLPPITYPI